MDDKMLAKAEIELSVLERQWTDAQKQLEAVAKKTTALRNKIIDVKLSRHFADGITPDKLLNIPSISWDHVPVDWHRKLTDWVRSEYASKGIDYGGYHPDTGQPSIRLKLDQNIPLEDQQGLLDFLPYIKPGVEGSRAGSKCIAIFEHTCAEDGIWELDISDAKIALMLTRWGRATEQKVFKSVEEAIAYIYKHHPYERAKNGR